MIALDTNVLVRYLIRNDMDQSRVARKLIGGLSNERKGYICREVLVELVWVLERGYRYNRREVAAMLAGLLSSEELALEVENELEQFIHLSMEEGYGIADLMIAAAAHRIGAKELVTFDRKLSRLVGVRKLSQKGSTP